LASVRRGGIQPRGLESFEITIRLSRTEIGEQAFKARVSLCGGCGADRR
jgi:hypothetical protein